MGVAIIIILLILATVVFHILSPWWLTPISSNWGMIDSTIDISVWVTGLVFIAVNLFMAFAIWRYRHRKQRRRAHYEPENRRLEIWLTALTTVGIVAMLAPGLFVWAKIIAVPDDAMEVEVVGQQWQWGYRFPGEDGEFGTTNAKFFSNTNPFGMNPEDPAGRDDILVNSNEVHLPDDRPVKVLLRSKDVLHDFAVPQFRVKMDMVPGTVSYFWFEPTRRGTFDVLCQELCGIGHYLMRGSVVIEDRSSFRSWLDQQDTYQERREQAERDLAAGKQHYNTCASCHGPEAGGNKAMNAPALAGMNADYLERQLRYFKEGIRGDAEGDTYGRQMAGMVNTLPDEAAIANVSAYIASLDPVSTEETVSGNPRRGHTIFRNCAACHGEQGQGIWSTKAPPLTPLDDWYLVRQLRYFQEGIRGSHPQDEYGRQMRAMSAYLDGEEAIRDVVAYINTLDDDNKSAETGQSASLRQTEGK